MTTKGSTNTNLTLPKDTVPQENRSDPYVKLATEDKRCSSWTEINVELSITNPPRIPISAQIDPGTHNIRPWATRWAKSRRTKLWQVDMGPTEGNGRQALQ